MKILTLIALAILGLSALTTAQNTLQGAPPATDIARLSTETQPGSTTLMRSDLVTRRGSLTNPIRVPEAATVPLILGGLGMAYLLRRRRD